MPHTLDPAALAAAQDTLDHVVDYMTACADLYAASHEPDAIEVDRREEIIDTLELDRDDVRDFPRMWGEMAEQAIGGAVADVEVYRLVGSVEHSYNRMPRAVIDESRAIVDLLWEYGGPTTLVRAEVDANGEVERVEVRTSRHLDEGVSASPMGRAATTDRDALQAVGACLAMLGVEGVSA